MITIATYADRYFGGVDGLWREAFSDDAPRNTAAIAIPQKQQFQPELFLVAIEEDEVIGSLMAGYDGHRGWISRVAVRQTPSSIGSVEFSMKKSAECSTKPRPVSTGPPLSTGTSSARTGN